MSIHAAVAAGACVILALVFGPELLVTAALVGLVGWSRVRLGDHTWPQVLAGFAIGAVVAGGVFAALR
jgi:membrane-associated phospholipid phosphatase